MFKKIFQTCAPTRYSRRAMLFVLPLISAAVVFGASWLFSGNAQNTNQLNNQVRAQSATDKDSITVMRGTQTLQVDEDGRLIKPLSRDEALRLVYGTREFMNDDLSDAPITRNPDGTTELDLQNRFLTVAIARQREDGTMEQTCVSSTEEAAQFFGIEATQALQEIKQTDIPAR